MPRQSLLMARLVVDGTQVPGGTLTRHLDDVTAALEECGVGPGTAVCTTARTGVPLVVTMMAADRLGAVAVLGEGPPGSAGVPRSVRAKVGADARGVPVVEPVAAFAGLPPDPALPPEGGAVFWTSGSGGTPKAVLLSRTALDYQAEASWERFEATADDHWLVPLPLAHAYGFSILHMWRRFGPALHVLSTLRPAAVADRLIDPRITLLDGVPGLYGLLLRLAERDPVLRTRLAGLRLRGCGGDVLPGELAGRFAAVVGQPIHDGYGLTEAGPNVAVSGPGTYRPGTVGTALRGTELRTDPATGEVLVRGPGLMTGYLGDPESTASILPADGWLRTGDRGELLPGGFLRITGRLKDVIIVQGETFAPSTVEDVLYGVAGVAEAAAVGVPHGSPRGDLVMAYVVPQDRGTGRLTGGITDRAARDGLAAALEARCRACLPPVLRPRRIELVPELPTLSSGKLDRAALRYRGQERHV
ncbi:class I adenylate-forming enzyme family protein [Actinomadura scrupuli]|uniref:class I adenylate-forming enzyme family protein n=1 Tax=Actinomadura scrupuli TaxID=559629 RepID=UPI003D996B52